MTRMVTTTRAFVFTDLSTENPVPLGQMARELGLPKSTIRTWAKRGCRGVRLEVDSRGFRLFTSRAAVDRFQAAVRGEWPGGSINPGGMTPRQADRQHRESMEFIDAYLKRRRRRA